MKRLVFVFALLALLAVPAPALAKEVSNIAVCGPDGCKDFGNPSQTGGGSTFPGAPDGGPIAQMPGPAAFYELRYTMDGDGEQGTWSQWYVPSVGMVASRDEREGIYWNKFDNPALAMFASTVRPFPKPEITAVTIGDRRITDDPASFLRLFTVQTTDPNAYPEGIADWQPVTFVSKQQSPWTSTQSNIHFSPSNGMLQRGIEVLKLPDEMAADLRSAQPLADDPAGGFPWRTVLFALFGALALLVAASFIRPLRRRLIIRRAPTAA
jgi:hypothetical protein